MRFPGFLSALFLVLATAGGGLAFSQPPYPGMGAVPVNGGTSFRVWAPNATGVQVRGEFNNWGSGNVLVREEGGYWYAFVPNAQPGHAYKYFITNSSSTVAQTTTVWRRDPYSRLVRSIGGGDSNSVIYNPNAFQWQGRESRVIAPRNELVVYEMHVGSFNAPTGVPATFDQAIARLDHLKALGINAIQILPPQEVPTSNGWGYDPILLHSIEQDLGGPDAFKRFVAACHERGLAVIVDVVYNHASPSGNDLWNFDLWSTGDGGGIYFFNTAAHRDTPWGPRFDYTRPEVQQYIEDSVAMYLNEFHVDGFRFDATGVMRNGSAGKIPGAEDMLRRLTEFVRTDAPDALLIAEDFQDDFLPTRPAAQGGLGFHAEWDALGYFIVRAVRPGEADFANLAVLRQAMQKSYNGDPFGRVIFAESHDTAAPEDPPHQTIPARGAYLPRRINRVDPETNVTTRKLTNLGSMIPLTVPGIPMLFMGQELYETGVFEFPSPGALEWDSSHPGILTLYRDAIALRRNTTGKTRGLTGNTMLVYHQNDEAKVMAWLRRSVGGPCDDTVTIANFSSTDFAMGYQIGVPAAGTWHIRLNTDSQAYDPAFSTPTNATTTLATDAAALHGFPQRITIPRLPPYTLMLLSQDGEGAEMWWME